MSRKTATIFLSVTTLAFLVFAGACSRTPPEEAILSNIKSMQQAAENKEARGAVKYLADNFSGNRGIDKTGLRRILAGVFLRHQNINVAITRMDIEVKTEDPFSAIMNGVVILTGAENILPQDGRVYKVTGEWQLQDDEWILVRAQWE